MRKITLLLILLPFIGLSQIQIGQDIDGENQGDQSGISVSLSIDGTTVAIGARSNAVNGTETGHVRIYENQSGTWVQIGQDIDGEAMGDVSGSAISLSSDGNTVAIGARGNDDNGIVSGHVRVYENQSGTWVQVGQDIDGEDSGDQSGMSVSLSSDGSIVAIGARGNSDNGSESGHVRIYENQLGTWVQIGQDIDGEATFDLSGSSVSLSSDGSIVAIGAPDNDGNGSASGHVRVYENQSGTWVQIGQDIDGESITDFSGTSVSLSSDGSIVAIGAFTNSGNGSASGHVRVYENQLGIWVQIGQDIDGEASFDRSGFSVSLSSDGSIVAIGAFLNSDSLYSSGHTRIYKNQSGTWVQIGQDIDGEAVDDQSGYSVSLSSDGSIVAIGAYLNDGVNGSDSGHVRIFSFASELALLEVIDDIAGNINGINISASQLNSITGVSGAIEGVDYTTALDNGSFVDENNPTAAEIQLIIDQVNATLSTQNDNLIDFKLYPNPTKHQFTIELNPSVQLEKVSVYNTLGQEVLISEELLVNTSKLASGTYIVEVITNKGKTSKKLIKE